MRLDKLSVTPAELTIPEGEIAEIEVSGINQFGGVYPIDNESLTVTIRDAEGHIAPSADVSYNIETGILTGYHPGVYTLDFNGIAECKATVVSFSEFNLATGKPATSSSVKGDSKASLAVDGNMNTRWESRHSTDPGAGPDVPEWITVDLNDQYELTRIIIRWEAAYARNYTLLLSDNGDQWHKGAAPVVDWNGKGTLDGTEQNLVSVFDFDADLLPATRYIRIRCDKRQLEAYGYSIYELEAYGKKLSTGVNAADAVMPSEPIPSQSSCHAIE